MASNDMAYIQSDTEENLESALGSGSSASQIEHDPPLIINNEAVSVVSASVVPSHHNLDIKQELVAHSSLKVFSSRDHVRRLYHQLKGIDYSVFEVKKFGF